MNKLALVVSFMVIFCTSFAGIYKWTDSQGNVHFSDTPHEGAVQLNIPESQSYSPPSSAPRNPDSGSKNKESSESDASEPPEDFYTKVEVIQPENEATIRNNQGYVAIAAQIEPDLLKSDNVQVLFDGAALGKPQHNVSFQLNGINRGSHTLSIQIIRNDTIIKTSSSITFYMQRPRVGMGAQGKRPNN